MPACTTSAGGPTPTIAPRSCFDNATRANLGGLKHAERVYLGLALLHRYSNKREGSRYEPLFSLLSGAEIAEAEVLGKAMRLGAMLWLGAEAVPARLSFDAKKKVLGCKVGKAAGALFGEVAEKRFQALASALGAEGQISRPPAKA